MNKNQSGFVVFAIAIACVIITVIGVSGFLVYHKRHESVLKNVVTILSPANGATVGREFSISGTAPKATTGDRVTMSLIIDGNTDWNYASTGDFQVSSSGHYSIRLNLNGNQVLEKRTAIYGGYNTQYKGISSGIHTFELDETQAGTVAQYIFRVQGPTLKVTIK